MYVLERKVLQNPDKQRYRGVMMRARFLFSTVGLIFVRTNVYQIYLHIKHYQITLNMLWSKITRKSKTEAVLQRRSMLKLGVICKFMKRY